MTVRKVRTGKVSVLPRGNFHPSPDSIVWRGRLTLSPQRTCTEIMCHTLGTLFLSLHHSIITVQHG